MYLLSDSLWKSLPTPGLDGLKKKKRHLTVSPAPLCWVHMIVVTFIGKCGPREYRPCWGICRSYFRENEALVHLIRVYCVNWEKVGKGRSGRKQSRCLGQIRVLSLRVWHGAALWPLCASTSSSVTWGQWGREPQHVDNLYREWASL